MRKETYHNTPFHLLVWMECNFSFVAVIANDEVKQ